MNEKQNTHLLTEKDIITASKIIKKKDDQIQSKKFISTNKTFIETASEEPYLEYESLLATQDLRIEIDPRTIHIVDQTYEQNIQYLSNLHVFSADELTAVTVFKDEVLTTKNFDTSISHFESAILSLPVITKNCSVL